MKRETIKVEVVAKSILHIGTLAKVSYEGNGFYLIHSATGRNDKKFHSVGHATLWLREGEFKRI